MKHIKTSDVLDPSIQQPFTAKSLAFLQDSLKENDAKIINSIVGETYSAVTPYILFGVVASGTNYSAGAALYNGEIYTVAARTGGAFVNVAVLNVTTADDVTADPVIFTDGVSRNVHNIRTLVMTDAVSGTGLFDLSTAVYLDDLIVRPNDYIRAINTNDAVTFNNVATVAETILTLTPSTTNTAALMRYDVNIELEAPSTDSLGMKSRFKLKRGATVIRTMDFTNFRDGGSYNFHMSWIDSYTAGDVITVTAEIPTSTATIQTCNHACLICEAVNTTN